MTDVSTPAQLELDVSNLRRLADWMAERDLAFVPPLQVEVLRGGYANVTYTVTDQADMCLVLRRTPPVPLGRSERSMRREYRVLSALAHSAVPTPVPTAFCSDESILGAPFYLMQFVAGNVLNDLAAVDAHLPEDLRASAALSFVDVLARVHSVPLEETGLDELGPGVDFVSRQVSRLSKLVEGHTADTTPLMAEQAARLLAAVPPQPEVTLVHGDYRMGNAVFGDDGNVRTVLDWELSTLADPWTDVGWMLAYWAVPQDPEFAILSIPSSAPGFPTRDEMADAYARARNVALPDLDFYLAYGYWRMAAILEDVHLRYDRGSFGPPAAERSAALAGVVLPLLEISHAIV